MKIDKQFREWWLSRKGEKLPDKDLYVHVQRAIQCHPESPRLWQEFIDDILISMLGFTPTTHEKCLDHKIIKNDTVYILRQVDDIAVVADTEATGTKIIHDINKFLKSKIKVDGITNLFNGIDITQTNVTTS